MGIYVFECGTTGETQTVQAATRQEAQNLCMSDFGIPCTFYEELTAPESGEEGSRESGPTPTSPSEEGPTSE